MEVSSPPKYLYLRSAYIRTDASSRPSFRSTLSQPSQMGNFKHQPLRSTDRDRDAERDLRSVRSQAVMTATIC